MPFSDSELSDLTLTPPDHDSPQFTQTDAPEPSQSCLSETTDLASSQSTEFRVLESATGGPGSSLTDSRATIRAADGELTDLSQESTKPRTPEPVQPSSLQPKKLTSSPVKGKSQQEFAVAKPDVPEERLQHRVDMRGRFVKMSTADFLEKFLPGNVKDSSSQDSDTERQRAPETSPFATMGAIKDEFDLQKQFLKCFNEKKICPDHVLVDTKDRPDRWDSTRQRVDACLFEAGKEDHDPSDPSYKEGRSSPSWDLHKLHIEFKESATSDAFTDSEGQHFETSSLVNLDTRGQIISYAALVFKYQHRCFLFTVLVVGLEARLLRWDRAGCVVTDKFNYQTDYDILWEFFHRFSRLTESQQGLDTTVQMATEEDRRMMQHAANAENKLKYRDYARRFFGRSLEAERQWWRVPVKDGDEEKYLLVGSPRFCADDVAGRGTRGYVALDPEASNPQRKFVWLKDVWRVDHPQIRQEGLILEELHAANVPNIPHLMFHGDVKEDKSEQSTCTQDLWSGGKGDKNPLRKHTHYRMVVREVGRRLETFEHGQVLISVLWNCIEAHKVAYEKARILHRDVSIGNILIVEPECESERDDPFLPQGILADWELSKPVGDTDVRQQHRTGTWQFMSAALLIDRYKMSTLQDDLESFFHVLLYIVLRYVWHNFTPLDVAEFMHRYFDAMHHREDGSVGGHEKYSSFDSGHIAYNSKHLEMGPGLDYPLNDIIKKLLRWFRAHYAVNPPNIFPASQSNTREIKPARRFIIPKPPNIPSTAATDPEVQEANTSLEQKLVTHDAFYNLLGTHLESPSWIEDKVEDQLPSNFSPGTERLYGDLASYATHSNIPQVAESSQSSSKRPREDDEDSPNKRINVMGPRRSSRLASHVSTRSASTTSKS